MTADAQFNRWMRGALVLFAVILGYVLLVDVTIPMTPHAMVQRPVVTVAPRVAGEVIEVAVTNNQKVQVGDLLFRLDPTDYQLAVEKAQLALEQAQQTNNQLKAQLAQAQATITETQVRLKDNQREARRLQTLLEQGLISQQQVDQILAVVDTSQAQLLAAQESRRALLVQLGEEGEHNLRLQVARNQLRQAQLDLERTTVVAAEEGVISNLQLVPGVQAQPNQALMSLVVTGRERIAADFREKSLAYIEEGASALVVFDAQPGKVYSARLSSRDLGVAQGQLMPNGQLATPESSDRWVRDAQRVRVYVALQDQTLPDTLVSGSRATVLLEQDADGLLHYLARIQMKFISLLHYAY